MDWVKMLGVPKYQLEASDLPILGYTNPRQEHRQWKLSLEKRLSMESEKYEMPPISISIFIFSRFVNNTELLSFKLRMPQNKISNEYLLILGTIESGMLIEVKCENISFFSLPDFLINSKEAKMSPGFS